MLKAYDGKPQPGWAGSLSLNAFVALFTTIAQFAYMVPVLEGLGQLRWLRFSQKSRPLLQFDAIDRAARTSPGGILLLLGGKGG